MSSGSGEILSPLHIMLIRMITLYAGPFGIFHPGEECNFSDEEARELLAGRYAVKAGTPEVETTKVPSPRSTTAKAK